MTATIHHIGRAETLLEFVARERVTNAVNVGRRFGWDDITARRELRKLVKAGQLVEGGRYGIGDYGGTRLEWKPA